MDKKWIRKVIKEEVEKILLLEHDDFVYIDEIGGWLSLSNEMESILEEKGFEGIDANLETSLFDYGLLYSPKHQVAIYYKYDSDPPKFQISKRYENYVKDELGHYEDDGFFQTLSSNKEEYLENFSMITALSDLRQYNGAFEPSEYPLDDKHLFRRLKEL